MNRIIIGGLFTALLLNCQATQKMMLPDSFVRYAKPQKSVKAITASGVRLKTFRFPNEPRGDLELWAASVREQLEKTGYRITASEPVGARTLKGILNETQAQYQGNEFSYLIVVFVQEEWVYTIEAAGEKAVYNKVRADILKVLETFEVD